MIYIIMCEDEEIDSSIYKSYNHRCNTDVYITTLSMVIKEVKALIGKYDKIYLYKGKLAENGKIIPAKKILTMPYNKGHWSVSKHEWYY